MPRWHTFEPGIPEEAEQRRLLAAHIDDWWTAFVKQLPMIERLFNQEAQWDLADWMTDHLAAIVDGLFWEFGPGIVAGHRLIITPESNRHLRPLVDVILSEAPQIPGWEFYGARLAEDLAETRQMVEARTSSPWTATGCRISRGDGHRIDVTFTYPPHELENDPDLAASQAFVATETLFGEQMLDRWIGGIEAGPAEVGDLTLDDAKSAFEREREAIVASLPQELCFERAESSEWTMWKLEPKEEEDYANQYDLFVGKSMYPELWIAAHANVIFHSSRFSTRETFCYLKLDGKEGIDAEGFADKAEIEDAVDAALKPLGLGCHIGGGTGRRYSYIDLALTDWRKALPVLRDVLRKGGVPKRSWLMFFDTDWSDEWAGIYPDSPVPPGVD